MGCSCNKDKNVEYEVTYKDKTKERFSTTLAAQGAIRKAGGGVFRAVRKVANAA